MKNQNDRAVLFLICLAPGFVAAPVYADSQVGVLTAVEGGVQIFDHPGQEMKGPAPHVKYQNEYYSVRSAKVGDVVENGNIVQTATDGRARVVYENGDQLNLGQGTAYRVSWQRGKKGRLYAAEKAKPDATKTSAQLELVYGKLRALVEKGGPRSGLKLKTRSATMGVRGTDFFVSESHEQAVTEVSVLRGEVAVTPQATPQQTISVKKGFTAEVPVTAKTVDAAPGAVAPKVELRATTKTELTDIQAESMVKQDLAKLNEKSELAAKVQGLEKQALTMTVTDIKRHDPELYAQMEQNPATTTDAVNAQVTGRLLKTAPEGPSRIKPSTRQLKDGEDAYQKYFKPQD
ncbi:MAG: FecR domain-containing protein [Bacteriovoracia bacterium]